jgi:hypothetical protein
VKSNPCDEVSLCSGDMLEELLSIKIDYGFFYFGEIRHRKKVEFKNDCDPGGEDSNECMCILLEGTSE